MKKTTKRGGKTTSFYITQDLRDLVTFLRYREEMSKRNFYRRAMRYFLAGDHQIDPRLRITEREDPEYIRRDVPETMTFDVGQMMQIKQVAAEQDCKECHVIFQGVLNYCAMLLTIDQTGVSLD
ncbi:hypothetical protein [uncultured Merdimonas sp.]|uniref:hypothetical protein n=1 Tax=uncultured Merdimonas sp. TaxID=2023269 RepID=UPI0032083C3E